MNPVGLDPVNGIGWKFLIVYCAWIAVETILIWWLWPETSGRTLEELAFRMLSPFTKEWIPVLTVENSVRERRARSRGNQSC